MIRRFLFITSIACTLLMVGCKSSRTSKGELVDKLHYCELLLDHSDEGGAFNSKSTVSINLGGNALSSKATIQIERDKAVQISVQPFLGIELFKVQFTSDTLLVLDRTKKRYLLLPLEQLPVAISPSTIQSLLLGEPFLLGSGALTAAQLEEGLAMQPNTQGGYEMSYTDNSLFNILFTGNAAAQIEQTSIHGKGENSSAYSIWSYSGYDNSTKPLDNLPRKVDATNSLFGFELAFSIAYSTPSWNKSANITITIPKGYSPMSLEELTNMLPKK